MVGLEKGIEWPDNWITIGVSTHHFVAECFIVFN